ncbi:hypothetical protein BU17DRAFT_43164 [Hysterangium stoloniferum]|nr:hypothetical protein BU17DRAFT_43164 [Hysterangium stoloniferum]
MRTCRSWRYYVHPEGSPYWHDPLRRLTTDANLRDPHILSKIEECISRDLLETESIRLSSNFETVLELDSDETWAYYLIDHTKQVVCYHDSACTEDLGFPEFCSIDHLNLELYRQYWVFVEYFPGHVQIPPSSREKLLGLMIHSWGDRATSDLSTSPYSAEDCRQFVDINNLLDDPEQQSYKNCIIARFMQSFYQARVINLYGEPGARLARNQSIQDLDEPANSPLFRLISIILFSQPKRELEQLNGLWVDTVAYTEHWRGYLSSRIEEWKGVSSMVCFFRTITNFFMLNAPLVVRGCTHVRNNGAVCL